MKTVGVLLGYTDRGAAHLLREVQTLPGPDLPDGVRPTRPGRPVHFVPARAALAVLFQSP